MLRSLTYEQQFSMDKLHRSGLGVLASSIQCQIKENMIRAIRSGSKQKWHCPSEREVFHF
jgi:hypothetical protein